MCSLVSSPNAESTEVVAARVKEISTKHVQTGIFRGFVTWAKSVKSRRRAASSLQKKCQPSSKFQVLSSEWENARNIPEKKFQVLKRAKNFVCFHFLSAPPTLALHAEEAG